MIYKKGQVFMLFVYLVVATLIILIAAISSPMGIQFTEQIYNESEQILLDANQSIQELNDTTIKLELTTSFNSAINSKDENIEEINNIWIYSFIFVLIITGIIIFMITKKFSTGGLI